jgi:hypothetical protein
MHFKLGGRVIGGYKRCNVPYLEPHSHQKYALRGKTLPSVGSLHEG